MLQKLIECPANDFVAFARSGFQPLAVNDLDSSASITYEAPRLKRLCGQCHARAAQPQHFGQPFLAERDGVVLALLTQNQQQPAQARGRIVHRIAQRRLLNLAHQRHVIPGEEIVDRFALAHGAAEGRDRNL